jgi:hypothetical protein
MKPRVFVSAVSAAALALCAIITTHAQEGAAGPAIPPLPFHLVENFFKYPAYSVNLYASRLDKWVAQ